jgi:hypothetical protein
MFECADMIYRNDIHGSLERCHDVETISRHGGALLYGLRYSDSLLL